MKRRMEDHSHFDRRINRNTHTHTHIHTYITKLRQPLLDSSGGVGAVCVVVQTISTHIVIHDKGVAPVCVCVCVCVCV
jgi:hypothetical protein